MSKIDERNIVDMYQDDMSIYKIAVNGKRISPDYRDGLKEVYRRILDSLCNENKQLARTKYIKSAMAVGNVMGKSHPHGDSSIYGAAIHLAQWFTTYIPLIKSESNIGSFEGDGPAAQRYTEIKLSDFCKDFVLGDMIDIKSSTDWYETFNGESTEPDYIPVKVPLYLINGNYGVGVGKGVFMPPHNINEVIDATINFMDHPDLPVVLVPDQCMSCDIIATNWQEMCRNGEGNFKVRGRVEIKKYEGVPDPNNKKKRIYDKRYEDLDTIVIRSLPDHVSMSTIVTAVNEMVSDKKLPQIIDSLSASTETEPYHIFVLAKGSDPNYVKNLLYKKTKLQNTQIVRLYAMVGTELVRFSYTSYIEAWVEFRKNTKFRIYCNKLQKVKTELHRKEAFIKVLESGKIDDIIDKIKHRDTVNDNDLMEYLIKTLNITDLQAEYIINASIKSLSIGYLKKYKAEAERYKIEMADYMDGAINEQRRINEIKQELLECKAKYGCPRRSRVITLSDINSVPSGIFRVVVTEAGYIKKLVISEKVSPYRGDKPKIVLEVDNRDDLIIYNEQGRMFKLPVNNIPLSSNNIVGYDLRILIKNNTSPTVEIIPKSIIEGLHKTNKKMKHSLVILTEGNMIKRLSLEDTLSALPSGVIYTKLKDNDKVISVQIVPNALDVIIYSKKKALRFPVSSIPEYRKNTIGVNAMDSNDIIDGMSILYPDSTDLLVITKKGKCNRVNVSALPASDRYKSGSRVINLVDGDEIFGIYGVNNNCNLTVFTTANVYNFDIDKIPLSSTAHRGTKLVPKNESIGKVEVKLKK